METDKNLKDCCLLSLESFCTLVDFPLLQFFPGFPKLNPPKAFLVSFYPFLSISVVKLAVHAKSNANVRPLGVDANRFVDLLHLAGAVATLE